MVLFYQLRFFAKSTSIGKEFVVPDWVARTDYTVCILDDSMIDLEKSNQVLLERITFAP